MFTIFDFEKIKNRNYIYHIQGTIVSDVSLFYTKRKLPIISFIVTDNNKKRIECLSFGEEAIEIKQKITQDKTYLFKHVIAVDNKTYKKTNHSYKLQLTSDTIIKESNIKQYQKSDKICVKPIKKCKRKELKVTHQLSIKNWLKR